MAIQFIYNFRSVFGKRKIVGFENAMERGRKNFNTEKKTQVALI